MDPDGGGSVNIRTGKFSHGYELILFIVEDLSPSTTKVGSSRGVIPKKAAEAINSYMNRISDGIGWKLTQYNGPFVTQVPVDTQGDGSTSDTTGATPPSSTDPTPTNPADTTTGVTPPTFSITPTR
jgi:hypothetical protein